MKPTPTEYKSIVFRSKCEAMFARCLDLAGFWWEYEPIGFGLEDGWFPDFKAVGMTGCHRLHEILVEYKPDDTTGSFLEKYRERIEELIITRKLTVNTACIVACGSYFNQTRICYHLESLRGPWIRKPMSERWSVHFDKSSEYRFDLK